MADLISTPGGQIHKRNQMYRDDGDGSHSEAEAANLWVWNTSTLVWERLSLPFSVTVSSGTVSVGGSVTVSVPGNVNVSQGTAGSLLNVAYFATDAIYSGSTAITPSFGTISTSVSGASTVVSAVTNKKIRVVNLTLVANAAVNVKFQSHVSPTDKTGLYYLAANGGVVLPFSATGWFETISGEALDINLSGAVAVGGSLSYICV